MHINFVTYTYHTTMFHVKHIIFQLYFQNSLFIIPKFYVFRKIQAMIHNLCKCYNLLCRILFLNIWKYIKFFAITICQDFSSRNFAITSSIILSISKASFTNFSYISSLLSIPSIALYFSKSRPLLRKYN